MKWLKGDPSLNALTLIVAGTVGTATGIAVEGLPLTGQLTIALVVGLIAGGLLYGAIVLIKRRRSS